MRHLSLVGLRPVNMRVVDAAYESAKTGKVSRESVNVLRLERDVE
jgi:hypothetical protein